MSILKFINVPVFLVSLAIGFFFVYIFNFANKIEGAFTKEEFKTACSQFLGSNKKEIKEFLDMYNSKNLDEARKMLIEQYYEMYYGNSDK
jgi:hypothetical protein